MTRSEPPLADVVDELTELKRGFDAWTSLPGTRRSGPPALELVESPLRAFFAKVTPDGVIAGKGDRPAPDPRYSSDMDIVLDFEAATWIARFRMEVESSPVLAHLDVSARSDWDSEKLASDLSRLQRTTDEARMRSRKTWTGLIAIGAGFHGRSNEIMELLHLFHHHRDLSEWNSTNAGSVWPFVDAVVLPMMCLKKHDLFEQPQLSAQRWPVLYPFPVAGHPGLENLWPLVPARAFLASYLRKATGIEPWDSPAWSKAETTIVLGGGEPVGSGPKDWRVIALRDDTPLELYHWTGNEHSPWQAHVRRDDRRCSASYCYSLTPRPVFAMTEERRDHIISILRHDLRWMKLLDESGSRLVAELVPIPKRDFSSRIGAARRGFARFHRRRRGAT